MENQEGQGRQGRKSRWWVYRYGSGGKRYHGLGPAHTIGLAEAREQARRCRQLILEGADPIAAGKARRAAVKLAADGAKSFIECAELYHAAHCASWSNRKHAREWLASLKAHVFPAVTGKRFPDIAGRDVRLEQGSIRVSTSLRSVPPWQARRGSNERFRTVGGELDGGAAGFAGGDRIGAFEDELPAAAACSRASAARLYTPAPGRDIVSAGAVAKAPPAGLRSLPCLSFLVSTRK